VHHKNTVSLKPTLPNYVCLKQVLFNPIVRTADVPKNHEKEEFYLSHEENLAAKHDTNTNPAT